MPVVILPRPFVRPFDQPIRFLDSLITLSSSSPTATVARIERDEIEPRMTTLGRLAEALEVDLAELVEGS